MPFKGVGDYLPADADTCNLKACIAGADTVALSVPGVVLDEGTVYTSLPWAWPVASLR